MKKLYLIMAGLLVCGMSQARELTFYLGNNVIEPNSTVIFDDIEEIPAGANKEVTMAPELFISSDIYTSKLMIKATCTSGQEIQMCTDGTCETGTTVTKENVKIQADQKLDLQFEYLATMPKDDTAPYVATTIEAQDGTHTETFKSFTLVMNSNGTGGVTLIENNNRLLAVEGGLKYDLEAESTVELFNLSGVKMLESNVSGSGIISTTALETGIYLYTIKNAQGKASGKVFVR